MYLGQRRQMIQNVAAGSRIVSLSQNPKIVREDTAIHMGCLQGRPGRWMDIATSIHDLKNCNQLKLFLLQVQQMYLLEAKRDSKTMQTN